jgi:hypothetical protein
MRRLTILISAYIHQANDASPQNARRLPDGIAKSNSGLNKINFARQQLPIEQDIISSRADKEFIPGVQ